MAEATIKAIRVTVKDLETGKILTDEITPLAVFAILKNANEKEDRFIQGISKKPWSTHRQCCTLAMHSMV